MLNSFMCGLAKYEQKKKQKKKGKYFLRFHMSIKIVDWL